MLYDSAMRHGSYGELIWSLGFDFVSFLVVLMKDWIICSASGHTYDT